MAAFGKKARVAHVWLTALLTLFAGAPHVQCRCPSGRLKPFCLSFLFRYAADAGCCCAAEMLSSRGSCCAAEGPSSGDCCSPDAPPAPAAAPSCCACAHAHVGQAVEAGAGAIHLGAPCCSRTLVQSADFAPTPSDVAPPLASEGVADLPSPGAPGVPLPGERGLLSWQTHLLAPPPTDLVTVLQRFLI